MNTQMTATDHSSAPHEMSLLGSAGTHRIPQQGGRPNVFQGTELALAMSFTPSMPYWYEINIYRTTEQSFVVAIRKFYQSEAEKDIVKSWVVPSIQEVFDLIENYDPTVDMHIPDVSLFDSSAAELAATAMALKADLHAARAHYAGLVGELFAEIEEAGVDLN